MEQWKDIEGYYGLYQVSDLGNVKSLEKKRVIGNRKGIRVYPEKILKTTNNGRGYLLVSLCKNGEVKSCTVHRLVYEAFNGKTDLHIDHIQEGNKLDNRLCNLKAITNRENASKYRLTTNKSSQYVGVHWDKAANKWHTQIKINGKLKFLGYFDIEYDAHIAYQNALQNLKVAELTIGV